MRCQFYAQIDKRYQFILEKTVPYILTYPENLKQFDTSPFGIEIQKKNIYSCIDSRNKTFFNLLQHLDRLSFGPVGMPMEKWVFFDCGEMPGGIVGLGVPAKLLSDKLLEEFQITKDYDGIVPISMYVAIPMINGDWFGHNLSSIGRLLEDENKFKGLGVLTKALALKVFNVRTLLGATQWNSSSLHIHLQLSDMDLLSTYTPAHSFNKTMTYRSNYNDQKIIDSLSGNKESQNWDILLDPEDEEKLKEMQNEIEQSKANYKIDGRPIYKNDKMMIPIKKIVHRK